MAYFITYKYVSVYSQQVDYLSEVINEHPFIFIKKMNQNPNGRYVLLFFKQLDSADLQAYNSSLAATAK